MESKLFFPNKVNCMKCQDIHKLGKEISPEKGEDVNKPEMRGCYSSNLSTFVVINTILALWHWIISLVQIQKSTGQVEKTEIQSTFSSNNKKAKSQSIRLQDDGRLKPKLTKILNGWKKWFWEKFCFCRQWMINQYCRLIKCFLVIFF